MYKKIIIAQSIKELKYILQNIDDNNFFCLPLNLKTQIYYDVSEIPFINFLLSIDKKLKKSPHFKKQINIIKYDNKNSILKGLIKILLLTKT